MTSMYRQLSFTFLMLAGAAPAALAGAKEAPPVETELSKITVADAADSSYATTTASSGTKTDTPLMETPVSVQVVSQQAIQDQKIMTLDQALKNVSGVYAMPNAGSSSYPTITLRGFSTKSYFQDGLRVDDNNSGFGNQSMAQLANVESIEVLKGPASVLYGQGEPGGMVNVIKKKPLATPYFSLEQRAGSWDHLVTSIDATGPVNESKTVLVRFIAAYDKQRSFQDHVSDEKAFLAPSFIWNISATTQFSLDGEYTHDIGLAAGQQVLPIDAGSGQIVWKPRSFSWDYSPYNHAPVVDTTNLNGNLLHHFNENWSIQYRYSRYRTRSRTDGFLSLNTVTQLGSTWITDFDYVTGGGRDGTDAHFLDLTGHFRTLGVKHTLLIGADHYRDEGSFEFAISNGIFDGTSFLHRDFLNPNYSDAPPAIVPDNSSKAISRTNRHGVYIQDQLNFADAFFLLGGLRYQRVKADSWSVTGTGFGGDGALSHGAPWSDHAVTPRLGAVWKARGWLSVYGNYTENFGQSNPGYDWERNPLKPEGAKQYETGAKGEFFGGKLSTTLALFDLTKINVSVPDYTHRLLPVCLLNGCNVNLGEVRSQGIEIDVVGELQPGWNAIFNYSNINARVTRTAPDSGVNVGDRLPESPRNLANLWTTYDLHGESSRGWTVGAGAHYSQATKEGSGYVVCDAMAMYKFKAGDKRANLQVNLYNLFDKHYYLALSDYGGTAVILNRGVPRSAMASFTLEF